MLCRNGNEVMGGWTTPVPDCSFEINLHRCLVSNRKLRTSLVQQLFKQRSNSSELNLIEPLSTSVYICKPQSNDTKSYHFCMFLHRKQPSRIQNRTLLQRKN